MIKLIAFDWNGTLLADTETTLLAINKNFTHYGLKPINLRQFQKTFHIPISSFWKNHGGKRKDLRKQSVNFHRLYEEKANFCRTRKGTRQLLTWLEKNRITSVIYSNHLAPEIVKQLLRLNIRHHFSQVLARPANDHSHTLARSKDKKLATVIKELRLKPSEVLTVGDSEEEIEIGKAFGYKTVAITGGFNSISRLKKRSPDFVINNLSALISITRNLNRNS